MTITGSTSYTGGTTFGSNATENSEIYVASGASMMAGTGTTVALSNGNLGGLGTVNGLVAMSGAGAIDLFDGKIGTLTIGSMSVAVTNSGGDLMLFDIGAGSQGTDKLAIAGGLSIANGQTVGITVANVTGFGTTQTVNSGTYTLVSYSGTQDALSDFVFSDSGTQSDTLDGDTLTLVENGDNLELVVTGASSSFYFTGSNGSDFSTGSNYSSDLAGTTAQGGTLGSTSDVFISANTQSATPTNGPVVNTATTIDSLTFNPNGAGSTVSGTATLTLLGTNNGGVGLADTATGGTTETVSAPIALGADQSWSVANAGNTLNVTNTISGAQNLALTGPGTYKLGGANTFQGLTVGTGSDTPTVLLTNGSNGSATGTTTLTVQAGATLGGSGTSSGTSFNISGTGTATGTRASVLVGTTSSTDTNTMSVLTLKASAGGMIANTNLTFNLNAQQGRWPRWRKGGRTRRGQQRHRAERGRHEHHLRHDRRFGSTDAQPPEPAGDRHGVHTLRPHRRHRLDQR